MNGVVDNTALLAYAWGISHKSIQNWEKKVQQDRKVRSDAGTSVITNSKKQQSLFTAYAVYKKTKRRQLQSEGLADTFDDSTIKDQWNALTEEERSQYDTLAKSQRERGPHLTAEIQDV